jgi:hypothetical protein
LLLVVELEAETLLVIAVQQVVEAQVVIELALVLQCQMDQ